MGACVINLTCPGCGVEGQIDINLLHAEQHPDWPALNRLIYTCPTCQQPQRHQLGDHQWQLINRMAGDLLRRVILPRGIISRFAPDRPKLDDDDLIAFCRELYATEDAP